MSLGIVSEEFNNLTWDIELNPASFWLFMRDIDEAALNLKTAIYSGNVNLTADFYKVAQQMSERKYWLITTNWQLSSEQLSPYFIDENWDLQDVDMTGKNPWLYMDHMRIWFWSWDEWNVRIQNDWEAFFWNDLTWNYMLWNWTSLIVRWDIEATTISADAVITNTVRWWKDSYSDTDAWYWLWLDWTTPKFNLWNSTNSLKWDWSSLNIKWNITAWNISWVNIDWSSITWSTFTSVNSWTLTTLNISWWTISLNEWSQYWKVLITPRSISILSSNITDKNLINIKQTTYSWWRFTEWEIEFLFDWIADTWFTIRGTVHWWIIQSAYDLTWLWISDNRINFIWVNTVWTTARTIAWYMQIAINSNTYYIPYYN